MELVYYVLLITLYLSNFGFGQVLECEEINASSGTINASESSEVPLKKCWKIEVPEGNYLRLNLAQIDLLDLACSDFFVKISVSGGESIRFCAQNSSTRSLLALNDVEVTCSLRKQMTCVRINQVIFHCRPSFFRINYHSESLICAQKNHFRCSEHVCIHQYQVCDGITDCANGTDEIGCETTVTSIDGLNESRDDAIAWLKSQRSGSFGWKMNTHRAITALYLSGAVKFSSDDLEEELMVKQLELQTLDALQRNSSDPLWISEISMYVNALSVTCIDPRQFFGRDLVQTLADKVQSTTKQRPGACLTLCSQNWTVAESNVKGLLKLLSDDFKFPFNRDIQAMAVLALTCIKNKTNTLEKIKNATKLFDESINTFIAGQHPDGSFGNIYTTALVTQALLSNGQEDNKLWNYTATMNFIMKEINASRNFLATYLVLPILNGRSLVDMARVNCTKQRDTSEHDISDITNKHGKKIQVQYSLYVGDLKDVIHTIYLRIPESSTYYDVMKTAQKLDQKYKLLQRQVDNHVYIYEINGIANDPETLKFWILFTADSSGKGSHGSLNYISKSPDQLLVKEGDHLVMWYKTLSI